MIRVCSLYGQLLRQRNLVQMLYSTKEQQQQIELIDLKQNTEELHKELEQSQINQQQTIIEQSVELQREQTTIVELQQEENKQEIVIIEEQKEQLQEQVQVQGEDQQDENVFFNLFEVKIRCQANYGLCEICFESTFTYKTSEECEHRFCFACLKRYIVTEVNKGHKIINCPQEDCKKQVYGECMTEILGLNFEFNPNEDSIMVCSFCQHQFAYKLKVEGSVMCGKCHVRYDRETQVVTERTLKEIEAVKQIRSTGIIECPRCLVWVLKEEGCDHITCTCTFQFCYRCARPWNNHKKCQEETLMFGGHLTTD